MGIYNPTKNVSPPAKMPQNSTDKIWRFSKYFWKRYDTKISTGDLVNNEQIIHWKCGFDTENTVPVQ